MRVIARSKTATTREACESEEIMIIGQKGEYSKKYYYVYEKHIFRYDAKIVDMVVKNAPFRSEAELYFLANLRAKAHNIDDIEAIKQLIQDQEQWAIKAEIARAMYKEKQKAATNG